MSKNRIYLGVASLFIVSLFTLLVINANNTLIQVYPENNGATTETQPIFKWVGKADKLILDDNYEFTSPIIENVDGNSHQIKNRLNFTTYYWKLIGKKETPVWQFSADSIVALQLKNNSRLYNITNTGTSDLDIEIREKSGFFWKITGNVMLEQNETQQYEIKNSTLFIAKQR